MLRFSAHTEGPGSDVISLHICTSSGFRRHFVGKTVANVSYCDIVIKYALLVG